MTWQLASIDIESGTAMDSETEFRAFCRIQATSEDGTVLEGQLEPSDVRAMAFAWLEAAEAADQDAIVMTMLTRDIGIPPAKAVGFIAMMRKERERREEVEETQDEPSHAAPAESPEEASQR